MFKSFPIARSFVKNSIDLVEELASIHVNDGYKLISLDVVSLFTNVPIERVLDSISVRWNFIAKNCNIPKSEFFTAVRLILNSTFFMFNGKIYRQTFGVPMGSPLSPMAADIVLQDLETIAFCTLKYIPPFYKRYIDDITLAAPSTLLQHTLDVFNSFHPRLKFTIEIGEDDKLNFLEITMILNNNRLTFDWFHKPTFSGRYLNFMSQHPVCQKRGTAIGLIDRAFLLSHPSLHAKNLSLVIGILLNNCYPLEFIYGILRERLKFLFNRDSNTNVRRNEEEAASFFTLPYIPTITEKFKNAIRELNVRLSYNSLNKMRTFIKAQKDSLPRSNKCNVVYKINCNDCDASYVGQTSRQLQTRIREHRNHINWNTPNHSVITEHRVECNHDFDWKNVEILDHESYYYKRSVSEMICIKRQAKGLNLQTDAEGLPDTYLSVIERLSKI
ncbi:uncharacterized protein [Temnothorax nylanderi]|uniref:uncharacterized protein n=1 Tax=Temnothorax nylanderi TaxID=102681 RepID=UPI003A855768